MRPERYHAEDLARLLRRRTIATMAELKQTLGTTADATVFRKLAELDYRTSYSHRGRYYTLDELCRFDALGLWSFRQVWFSAFGTLLATAEALVAGAEAGYSAAELDALTHVDCKQALAQLAGEGRLARQRLAGRYVYLAPDAAARRRQLAARNMADAAPAAVALGAGAGVGILPDELKAAIVLFYSLLDERQRRLYAGLEAAKIGHGGDVQIADLLGLDAGTVARGRQQLLAGDVDAGRVRRAGGGRKPAQKKGSSQEFVQRWGA